MCGICGVWNYRSGTPIEPGDIEQMKDTLLHRGPDDEGSFISGAVGLGFRRLSIIDLESGAQPMTNERGDIWISFNGEIYNYRELRTDLEERGHLFKTRSDTEVIIHSYEEYGIQCLEKLRGMFAFAIWDGPREKLFLARDRLGIKPLYFYDDGSRFAFASELKALRVGIARSAGVNHRAVRRYVTFGFVSGRDSMLEGVSRLLPGELLIRTRAKAEIQRYWKPNFCRNPSFESADVCAERTRELLLESTKLRLNSDVPLGVFLSGGLDSTSILAAALAQGGDVAGAFSVGFKDAQGYDETEHAREAAEHFGVKHHILKIDGRDFLENMERFVWHQDEPLADPTGLPLFLLSREAKKSVTVLLSGEGADEIFAGYHRYKLARILGVTNHPTLAPVRAVARTFAARIPSGTYGSRVAQMIGGRGICEQLESVLSRTSERMRVAVLGARNGHTDDDLLDRESFRHLPPLDQMQLADISLWLPDQMLLKKDRMTMAASIEARVPALDHKLVEFVLQIPPAFRMRGFTGKWIFRKAMNGLIPAGNRKRRKMGWPIPLNEWFRGELRTLMGDVLLGSRCRERRLLNPQAVSKLVDDHVSGRAEHGKLIFLLLCLEMWLEAYDL